MGSVWPHSFADPWSKALSLHCYQDNYSWYYLLELGLPRTKTEPFFYELLECVGVQSPQDANPCSEMGSWAVGTFYSSWNPAALTHSLLSITFSAGRQPLLTSLFAKYQLGTKKSRGFALKTDSDTKTKQEFETYGVNFWKLVLGARQWLQGTHRRVGKGQISPLPHRGCKNINWRLHLCYISAAPVHLAKPFQTHLYFCQGEFTNLISCIWKDTGFCSF